MTGQQPSQRRHLRVLHCRVPQGFGGSERQILGLMERAGEIGIEQELLIIVREDGAAARGLLEKARERGLPMVAVHSRGRMEPARDA